MSELHLRNTRVSRTVFDMFVRCADVSSLLCKNTISTDARIQNSLSNSGCIMENSRSVPVHYRKGPPSQTVRGCQFSSTKLQKLENPFALCTLPGMQSPGALAVTLKSGGARAPPGYMAPAPLQLGASRIPLSAAQSQDFRTGKWSRIPGLGSRVGFNVPHDTV